MGASYEDFPQWLLEREVLAAGKLTDSQARWEIAWDTRSLKVHHQQQEVVFPPVGDGARRLTIEVARREGETPKSGGGWLLVRLFVDGQPWWWCRAEVKQRQRLEGLPWRDTNAAQVVRLDLLQSLLVVARRVGVGVVPWDAEEGARRFEDTRLYALLGKMPGGRLSTKGAFAASLLWVVVLVVLAVSGVLSSPKPPQSWSLQEPAHFEVCDGPLIEGKQTWVLTSAPHTQTVVLTKTLFALDWLLVGWFVICGVLLGVRVWEARGEPRAVRGVVWWTLGAVVVLGGLVFLGLGSRVTLDRKAQQVTTEATLYGVGLWSSKVSFADFQTPHVSVPNPQEPEHQLLTLDGIGSQPSVVLAESHDGQRRPLSVLQSAIAKWGGWQ